jgi:hypothetical protein
MLTYNKQILAREKADVTMPELESQAYALQAILSKEEEYTPTSLSLYPTDSAKAFWKAWIIQESARRTFLLAFFFLALYHALKGHTPYCEEHPALPCTWTASAHLWNASSVFDFAVAWNEKRHFVVQNMDNSELLEHATPSDIDYFGRVLLVTDIGIDDVRGWFHTRGGCL